MDNELEKVNDWLAENKLSLNIAITNYILFRTLPITNQVQLINNVPVPRVSTAKFLGVHADQLLTCKDYKLYPTYSQKLQRIKL